MVANFVAVEDGLFPALQPFLYASRLYEKCNHYTKSLEQGETGVHLAGPGVIEAQTNRCSIFLGPMKRGPCLLVDSLITWGRRGLCI